MKQNNKFSFGHIWLIIWIIVYFMSFFLDCTELLGNKGMDIIQGEYYRFFTALLVHVNLLHLVVNILGLYYTAKYLKERISAVKLLILSGIAATIANLLFSLIYPGSVSIGGSPVIYAMLGITLALHLLKKNMDRFNPNTVQTRWMLGYGILGNIPIFSGNISTLVIHLTAFVVAFALGSIVIKTKLL